jgi:hypothetical protein
VPQIEQPRRTADLVLDWLATTSLTTTSGSAAPLDSRPHGDDSLLAGAS